MRASVVQRALLRRISISLSTSGTVTRTLMKTRGWSIAINEEKGNMSLAVHDDASSYVIFGACTPR